jgi:nitrogen regulatory protein PII
MKLVMAIVRPNKVDDVTTALEQLSVPGLTVTEVRGHGRQRGHTAMYRGKEYDLHLLPKVKIETVLPNHLVDSAVDAIEAAARTGEVGDGRVFVFPVERSTNIRTGETES